ncbi:hypothetical protein FOPG_18389 [Fusarium oxysporum f. sp. conglutinans race 2 54008]|uniref:Uncharacterized protein n=1 Tax=Fusarium oxysporum f. sp. conglutinans race 2 54008 TaxID=1089457 RepID=X0HW68_FUSOX|nr:hypothetical protein FOPG_18389 [Fusarium oxysporum f. sp. conglutinans race 2 54008]
MFQEAYSGSALHMTQRSASTALSFIEMANGSTPSSTINSISSPPRGIPPPCRDVFCSRSIVRITRMFIARPIRLALRLFSLRSAEIRMRLGFLSLRRPTPRLMVTMRHWRVVGSVRVSKTSLVELPLSC